MKDETQLIKIPKAVFFSMQYTYKHIYHHPFDVMFSAKEVRLIPFLYQVLFYIYSKHTSCNKYAKEITFFFILESNRKWSEKRMAEKIYIIYGYIYLVLDFPTLPFK